MIINSPELIKIPYEYLAKAKNFEIILNNLAHKIKNNICQENQIKQKVGRKQQKNLPTFFDNITYL